MSTNIIGLLFTALACLTGCDQAPQGLTIDETGPSGPAIAQNPVAGPVLPQASPSDIPVDALDVQTIPVTVRSLSRVDAPQSSWPTKTYTSTGYCLIYQGSTYCWDDGMKTLTWTASSNTYGPFYYSYFNMSRNAVGWSHSSGGMAQDLMPVPTYVSANLGSHMAAGAVNAVLTTGAQTTVQCTEASGVLTCPTFVVDTNQAAL